MSDVQEPLEADATSDAFPAFVVMDVVNVMFHIPDPHPIINLQEQVYPFRPLTLPVGLPEAQAVGLALEGREGARPSTHELFASVLRQSRADVIAVRITDYQNGTFFAELDLATPQGRVVIDCRPSDGIILALRQPVRAPVLCDEEILSFLNDQS